MPQLDVSFVIADPMLADVFTVLRYADIVGQNGRTTPTLVGTYPNTVGTVTRESPSELMRNPDAQQQPRKIFVATSFRLRGVSQDGVPTQYQPDVVVYDGDSYTLQDVLSYSRYGAGIVEAIGISRVAVDLVSTS